MLDFTLISAAEIGGVIEAVEPREGNQAAGPLLDCIRESAFSMALPPASNRGSTPISLEAFPEWFKPPRTNPRGT